MAFKFSIFKWLRDYFAFITIQNKQIPSNSFLCFYALLICSNFLIQVPFIHSIHILQSYIALAENLTYFPLLWWLSFIFTVVFLPWKTFLLMQYNSIKLGALNFGLWIENTTGSSKVRWMKKRITQYLSTLGWGAKHAFKENWQPK